MTEPRRQAIVMLSDGQDTSSTFTFDELLKVVQSRSVSIYTIVPRPLHVTTATRQHLSGDSNLADFGLRRSRWRQARDRFPHRAVRAGWRVQHDRHRAGASIFTRIRVVQLPRRRPIPAYRAEDRRPGPAVADPRGYIAARARASRATLGGHER